MIFVFGECELDVERRELRRAGGVRALEPKAFTVLVHLLTQRHRAVAKDELLATCWPGEFVTEAALTRCLKVIRQAVGDDGVRQHLIKTLRGHGYHFIATVETLPLLPAAPAPADAAAGVARVLPRAEPIAPAPGWPCPQCQTVNRVTRQFCAACGQALWVLCPQCGFGNEPTERFCGGCGRDVAAPMPVAPGARRGPPQAYTPAYLVERLRTLQLPPPGERKLVTVLVGEVAGLRTLRQAAAPEVVDDVLNRGFALLVAEVYRVEGFLSQVAGPGFTALFGAPLACEDHVLRALHAALGLQRTFTDYAAEVQQTLGVSLALRLGVHTGPLVVHALRADLQLTYTAPGATLEMATALPQLAPAGTIIVSAAVHEVAAGFFRFTTMGPHTLPELAAPVGVYTCDGVGPVTSRLAGALARQHTALQGRAQELALLQTCWERVRRGAGQVVCLVGEAGVGKSRLAYECQQRLADARWLTVQALSYGQAMPYHAVLPLLRTLLGVVDTAPPSQQREAIRTQLAALAPALAVDTPLLAQVLGVPLEQEPLPALTPAAQRRRLHQTCLQVLLQATATPLGLLVEDGHWLDPSSQELLDLLVATIARRPIFVLCTARPGFRHVWADYTYFHQVTLESLSAAETGALLENLLQPYRVSATLQAWIRTRTGGNPFFVEELVRALQAHGLLTAQGAVYEVAPAAGVTLPGSIQGIVQTRLDQLPVQEKSLLQRAAVIGPAVPLPLLQALVGGAEAPLSQRLAHLQALEFLYETHTVPTRTYTFKHALVQEAIYQSLLQSTRQAYHRQIAQVLEEQWAEMVAAQPEVVAQHYTAAGLSAQALHYWQRAGQRAIERSAHVEAISHLTKGLEILQTLPETPERVQHELSLHVILGAPLMATKGLAAPEVEQVYARARELCQQVGQTPQLFPVLVGLWRYYLSRAEYQTAHALDEQLLQLAQGIQDSGLLLEAHRGPGQTLFLLGNLNQARMHLEQAITLYNLQQHRSHAFLYGHDAKVLCLSLLSSVLWLLGFPGLALEKSYEALTLARGLAHPPSLAIALATAATFHQHRRDKPAARACAEEAMSLSDAQGFPFYLAMSTILRGWALAGQGQEEEGMAQLRQGLAAYRAMGAELGRPYYLALLAETYGAAGQGGEGLAILTEALATVNKSGERFWEAEISRLQGECLLQQATPNVLQAETCFQQALTIARRQHAKALELRAAMSLARLWQRQGQPATARQLLTEVYGWFTEGFDTADLREAQALLEELT